MNLFLERHKPAMSVVETLAARHQVLPLSEIRRPNSATIVELTTRLARGPVSNHPWLPIGTLGPLLIMGHYNPVASDHLGVPKAFRVEAVIDNRAYDERFLEFFMRWSCRSCQDGRKLTSVPGNLPTMKETLDWFIENYPLTKSERLALVHKLKPILEEESVRREDVDQLIPQLGIALERIRTRCLVFNPAHAPGVEGKTRAAVSVFEQHQVYPLLESPRTRYWLCNELRDLKLAEKALQLIEPTSAETIPVLADRQAIRDRLRRPET